MILGRKDFDYSCLSEADIENIMERQTNPNLKIEFAHEGLFLNYLISEAKSRIYIEALQAEEFDASTLTEHQLGRIDLSTDQPSIKKMLLENNYRLYDLALLPDKDIATQAMGKLNNDLSGASLEELNRMLDGDNFYLHSLLAKNGCFLYELIYKGDHEVITHCLKHPSLDIGSVDNDFLRNEIVYNSYNWQTKLALVSHHNLFLEELAFDSNDKVSQAAIMNKDYGKDEQPSIEALNLLLDKFETVTEIQTGDVIAKLKQLIILHDHVEENVVFPKPKKRY